MQPILVIVTIYLITNFHTTLCHKVKRQNERVCPTTNICGDGVCQVTTHPDYKYQYVCKCNDGTYKFEVCKATTTAGKCSNQPCYPNVCIETITSPSGYLCYCGGSDYRPSSCSTIQPSTCQANSCLNGATCVAYNPTVSWCNPFQNGQTCCICRTGFTGYKCETDIDECGSSPCKNGGVCDNNLNSYSCRCPFGFSGINCEITATLSNGCSPSPCKNSGACLTNTDSSFKQCICPSGTAGTYCETIVTNPTSCSAIQCVNGFCQIDAFGNAYCVCSVGFTGTRCELTATLSNGCSPSPCRNSGVCLTNTDSSFKQCQCPSGTAGTYCETIVTNPTSCSAIQCVNGFCQIDAFGKAYCVCSVGFSGTRCELTLSIQTGACSTFPCGTYECIATPNVPNGFICKCGVNDYRLTSCTATIISNGCFPSPCKNSGICLTNTDLSFRQCQCPAGTSGTYCEISTIIQTSCNILQCTNGVCQTDANGRAYCYCKAGFTGTNCESEYFRCTKDGTFKDPIACAQGKYLQCVYYGQSQVGYPYGILYQRDCPTGLRYNTATLLCDYAINILC